MKLNGLTMKKTSIKATFVSLVDGLATLNLPDAGIDVTARVEDDTSALLPLVGKSVVITGLPDGSHEVKEAVAKTSETKRQGSSCSTRERDIIG